jgi:hypothetical protein
MNNLAMAYTMDGQAARGEALLRQAASTGTSDPRVQQNLALVVGLQGKEDGVGAAQTVAASNAPSIKPASWDKALPIEQAAAPPARASKTASKAAPKAAAIDPDAVIRQAMAAENAKSANR